MTGMDAPQDAHRDVSFTPPPENVSVRWRAATIERIETATSRVRSLFLRTDASEHVAGQHLDVRLTAPDGYQAQRSYSIASAPGDALIELAVERLDDGEVSPYLCDVALPGDTIDVRGPIGGHFVWRAAMQGPLLLIAGGSGVAPLMSMLRARAATAPEIPAMLLYSSRTWEEIIFREELLQRSANEPQFTFIAATTRGPKQRDGDVESRLTRRALREALDRWTHAPRHVYVCGSNAFVEFVTTELQHEGVAAAVMRAERYGGIT